MTALVVNKILVNLLLACARFPYDAPIDIEIFVNLLAACIELYMNALFVNEIFGNLWSQL